MSRYIDADALIAMYKGNILTAQTDYAEGVRDVINDIKGAPSIEPQPCEWCKFYDGENCFSQEPCKVMLYFKIKPQTEREGE